MKVEGIDKVFLTWKNAPSKQENLIPCPNLNRKEAPHTHKSTLLPYLSASSGE